MWQQADRSNGYLDPTLAERRSSPVRRFVSLPLDKRQWRPSPLPGQIVLITTLDDAGEIDVAPKSWVSMAAFDPPTIGFGCNVDHRTHANVCATGEFVVNVLPTDLAPTAWAMPGEHGTSRVEDAHLQLGPAQIVSPPVILDCPAHLECRHERTVEFDSGEVFVFGRIVAVTIDAECEQRDPAAAYARLDPCFFLQDRLYGGLRSPSAVE